MSRFLSSSKSRLWSQAVELGAYGQHGLGIGLAGGSAPAAAHAAGLLKCALASPGKVHVVPASGDGVENARKVAAMSPTLFERRFRRRLGCAPYEHILKVRLAKARELLALTNLTLAEISERTGFASPEYFSAALHKRFKTSPRELRQSLRQGR